MTDPKKPQWRLEAAKLRNGNGFALRLIGDGDLGEAVNSPDALGSIPVETGGRTLSLYDALLELINSRVSGFIVLMDPVDAGCSTGRHQAARSRGGLQ